MPNMLAIDRVRFAITLSIETQVRLDRMAEEMRISRNELINVILERETRNVQLTNDDVHRIVTIMEDNLHARQDRNRRQ